MEVIGYRLKDKKQISLFEKAVEKAKEYYAIKNNSDVSESDLENEYIFVKANQQLVKLSYGEILYVEAFADYVKIFLNDRKIVTLQTMKKMETKLGKSKILL